MIIMLMKEINSCQDKKKLLVSLVEVSVLFC